VSGSARRRLPSRLALLTAVAALTVVAAGGAASPTSSARFVDAASSGASFSVETLDPPTGLAAATAGSTVTLTWIPTVDAARATGYQVLRGTSPGGPYTEVGTVVPATSTTTTDGPGTGTFVYVLRATAGLTWISADSNEANATVIPTISTGTQGCSSNAADTGGDSDGYETTPGLACGDGGGEAADIKSGSGSSTSCASPQKDRHRFWGYTFGLPTSVTSIDDVTVRLDLRVDNLAGSTFLTCVELSWDGGSSWTAPQSVEILSATEQTYLVGGTWGRTWTPSELDASRFRVRLTDVSNNVNRTFYLDDASVAVTYTP
jgi:hypothetical protein